MTPIEKAIAQLGGPSAVGRLFGVVYQTPQQWILQGRVPAEYCPRIEQLTGIRCEELNERVDWSLIRGTAPARGLLKTQETQVDHAAELRSAILQTRAVFASEPVAGDVLNYLEAVLASAPAGGGGASATEETLTAAGAESEAEPDGPSLATGTGHGPASKGLINFMPPRPPACDQAAAAMAAESAQLVADAERSVAASTEPLTLQQVDKIEDRMLALLAEPLTCAQRTAVRDTMVAEFRALNAMGVQP